MKVIFVCLAVKNLYPFVYLILFMDNFLFASRTYLWEFDGIF